MHSAGTLTGHCHRVRWQRIHIQCPRLRPPAAELCTAQSDRQLARSGMLSTHWKSRQAIVQALPPDAGKAAVGAYEQPGAVCSIAAPAAAEAHRHAVVRLLVAAAQHMSALKRQPMCRAQGAGRRVDITQRRVTACIAYSAVSSAQLQLSFGVCQLKQSAEHNA